MGKTDDVIDKFNQTKFEGCHNSSLYFYPHIGINFVTLPPQIKLIPLIWKQKKKEIIFLSKGLTGLDSKDGGSVSMPGNVDCP